MSGAAIAAVVMFAAEAAASAPASGPASAPVRAPAPASASAPLSGPVGDGAAPPEPWGFAEHLLASGDFYRAIGEYRRFLYLYPGHARAAEARLRIGMAYLRGEQWEAARAALVEAAATGGALGDEALVRAGEAALRGSGPGAALETLAPLLEEGTAGRAAGRRARYLEGWALVRLGRYGEAAARFGRLDGAAEVGAHATALAAAFERFPRDVPRRSPALAGVLSIVPGLGHVYLGDARTAILAFLWNGAWGFATAESIYRGAWGPAVAFGLVTLLWYSGTIFGAVSGAHRFNRDARANALVALEEAHPLVVW